MTYRERSRARCDAFSVCTDFGERDLRSWTITKCLTDQYITNVMNFVVYKFRAIEVAGGGDSHPPIHRRWKGSQRSLAARG